MQGRRLLTSLVRSITSRKHPHCRHCQPKDWPRLVPQDPFGRPRPRPIVLDTIECIKRLHPDESKKFGYVFSELLGLPKPRKIKIKDSGEKFDVKLVQFDPDKQMQVLRELAWVKTTDVVKSMYDLGMGPMLETIENIPAVFKQGVSKEEANEITAKIKAAGGVAVMEPSE